MNSPARRDVAVILARGASRRMGRPKGLCRLPGDDRALLRRIADLHREAGRPVAVVTLPALREVYGPLLEGPPPARWILAPPGGGTAVTALVAVRALPEATHLWLHPVDLPGVGAQTLAALDEASAAAPGSVVAPVFAGRPGHPVVLPAAPFRRLASALGAGPLPDRMRVLLTGADTPAPLLEIAVDDPGVVADLDRPEDLAAAPATRPRPEA